MKSNEFDVIVIGAGHAGLESAFASSNIGLKTALITLNEKTIGMAPCNPSVGGPAKGVVTREIDALGGMQGIAADANQLQMKMLNSSKGAGVRALRAQIDKVTYSEWFINKVKEQKNLTLVIDEVSALNVKNGVITGVNTVKSGTINSKKVIITAGVYMKSITHCGLQSKVEGPMGLENSRTLSDSLRELGFKIIRLKTGTPPRVLKSSIDFTRMSREPGTNKKLSFGHFNPFYLPFKKQQPCFLTYTNSKTHDIIRSNLKLSAMYSGNIKGVGPRYCPSIEDKVVRFSDKERHQTFMEPESMQWDSIYLQGLSTSLPANIQEEFVHTIKGLENAKFLKYAYAIEYDAIDPTQLYPSLETKAIKGLYLAGQVNGSSGYEEAAGQGLMAGINAALACKGRKPLILGRDEAYIGVMIDDLVTKGITDPYRLLTSRAEYRLQLRDDNADDRLCKHGYEAGLLSKSNYNLYLKWTKQIAQVMTYLKNKGLSSVPTLSKKYKNSVCSLYELLKRQTVHLKDVLPAAKFKTLTQPVIDKIEIMIKFEGYIKKQDKYIDKFKKWEKIDISSIRDYSVIENLSLEARDKLNKIKPQTLGQAERIQGINMPDLIVVKFYLEQQKNDE